MAKNLTNVQKGQINDTIQTLPYYNSGTGTYATFGKGIEGTSTKFLTELAGGSWLFDGTEVRRVEKVVTDTLAYLEDGFSTDIVAGSTPLIIDAKEAQMKSVSVAVPLGQPSATVDGFELLAGRPETMSKLGNNRYGRQDFVNPIIVNGNSTLVDWTIQY